MWYKIVLIRELCRKRLTRFSSWCTRYFLIIHWKSFWLFINNKTEQYNGHCNFSYSSTIQYVHDLSMDRHLPPRHLVWVVYTIDDGEFTFTLIFLYVRRCQKCTLYERNGIYFISEFKMAVFHFLRLVKLYLHWNDNGATFFFSLHLQIGDWLRMINVRFIESNKKEFLFYALGKKKSPIPLWLISSTGSYIYIRIVVAILIVLSLITFTIIPSMNWM